VRLRVTLTLAAIGALLVAAPAARATTPDVGTPAERVDLRSLFGADGTALPADETAIPLKGARPSWYTPELERRVEAAGGQPVAAPNDAPLPSEVGIRPGSWMVSPAGCTMNFVFGSRGSYSIGTAGHCASRGQAVVLLTVAPGGGNPVLVNIGTVTTSVDGGIGNDFALVSIRPQLQGWVSPTAAVIAGPCGSYTGRGPETVAHYGHGIGIGTGGTPRVGVALTWRSTSYGWDGAAIFGDSGSPVRVTRLQAAGNLTHLVVDRRWLPSFIAGTRIGRMVQIAGKPLARSPLC
jgi:hypothetical protein